jgi:hypothetical protein
MKKTINSRLNQFYVKILQIQELDGYLLKIYTQAWLKKSCRAPASVASSTVVVAG